mmetsp:Transcript_29846/g.46809  ORF Transcript_29846/g.46809 Transcript_29846/m.46809 type:complete len:84 (+) Transcript_29846:659-910(+)
MGQQNTIVQAESHTSSQDWEDWGTPMVDGGAGKNNNTKVDRDCFRTTNQHATTDGEEEDEDCQGSRRNSSKSWGHYTAVWSAF